MNGTLKDEWLAFELEEFPESCLERRTDGLSWAQVDAVAAGLISTWLAQGSLDAECRALLDDAIRRLDGIAGEAAGDVCSYFKRLLEFAKRTRDESAR